MLIKIFKYGFKLFGALLLVIIAFLIVALILSLLPTDPKHVPCKEKKELYLFSSAIHTDIIVPVAVMEDTLIQKLQLPATVQYVAFGYGDRKFYLETPTWDDLKMSVAIRALLLPSESIMHLLYYPRKQVGWKRLGLCDTQYRNLLGYILSGFKTDSQGQYIEIPSSGYSKNDKFYQANGHFSILNTCNNWVNTGLKKAQVKTSLWSPFVFGINHHLGKKPGIST